MKSLFLTDVKKPDLLASALSQVLPSEGTTWILSSAAGDPVAYFSIVQEEDAIEVQADMRGRNPEYTAILAPARKPVAVPVEKPATGRAAGVVPPDVTPPGSHPALSPTEEGKLETQAAIKVAVRHLDHGKPIRSESHVRGLPPITVQRFEILASEKYKSRVFSVALLPDNLERLRGSEYLHLIIPISFVEQDNAEPDRRYWNFAKLVVDEPFGVFKIMPDDIETLAGFAIPQSAIAPVQPRPVPDTPPQVIVSARHLDHAKAIRSVVYLKEGPDLPDITVQKFEVLEPAEFKGRVFTLKILGEATYPLEKADHFQMAIPRSCLEKKEPDKNYWKFSDLVLAETW